MQLKHWSLLALLPVLSTPLAAQLPAYANSVPIGMEVSPYPASPYAGGGNFERVDLLDLDDDGALDAVALDAGYVVFMYNPEDFRANDKVQKPALGGNPAGDLIVNDFVLLDEASDPSYGGYGTIVTVGADGLSTYVWDASTREFVMDFNTGGDWVDAVQVELADFESDGDLDIYALDLTGSEVHVMLNDGAYGWTTRASIPLSTSVAHFQLLDWQGNARPEIAGTNSAGLYVFSSAGSQIASRTSLRSTDMLAAVETSGSYDELAWVEGPFTLGPEYTLSMIDSSGLLSSRELPSPEVPITLASGFWDTDANEDVALTFMNTFDVLVVDYNGTDIDTSPQTTLTPTPTTNYGGHNQAPVAFGDLDWDGKTDLVLASTPAHALLLLHHEPQVLGGTPLTGGGDGLGFDPNNLVTCIANETQTTGVDYVSYYEAAITVLNEPNAVNWVVTTWRQPTASSYLEEDALRNCYVPSGDISGLDMDIKLNLPIEALQTSPSMSPHVFHIKVTPVNANDRIVGRSYIGSFARVKANLGNSQGYIEIADDWTTYDSVDFEYCDNSAAGDWVRAGHQGSKGLPPLPPNTNPNPVATCPTLMDN